MKADLHVHSKFSKRPSQWILQKMGCPESFTEPLELYRIAQAKGMAAVTITDHNTISGALEIAHLPNTFIGEEVTTYFPEDGCKIHVLVFSIDERQHESIQKARENIFDLIDYLGGENIFHAVAHPLYAINDRLTTDHFEKLLLLFKHMEINGARNEIQNRVLECIASRLNPAIMERLEEKHGIRPAFDLPWEKVFIGGSDDHSSLNIARTWTEVPGASDVGSFLRDVQAGKGTVGGVSSTPLIMAHNLYGIAYQFYKHRLHFERQVHRDQLLQFLERVLQRSEGARHGDWSPRLGFLPRYGRVFKRSGNDKKPSAAAALWQESHRLISNIPALKRIADSREAQGASHEEAWFDFVNRVSNNVLAQFSRRVLDQIAGADFFDVFNSIGSAGTLYTLLAPYFVSFSLFTKDIQIAREVKARFQLEENTGGGDGADTMVLAHFTDTLYQINGVALTILQQAQLAAETGRRLTVITCHDGDHESRTGVVNFKPVGVYQLPEYPEIKLYFPPFLDMLRHCFEKGFTHILSATPGPIGLAALAIARILNLPISATYHTALPQYARHITGDAFLEDIMWKFVLWYYQQMDTVYVPSRATGDELVRKGIAAEKIQTYTRGVDIEYFHPSRFSEDFERRYGLRGRIRLLYVGRVSKEKNLDLLVRVFKRLNRTIQNLSLVVVGDGPYLNEMKAELEGMPAVFTGYLSGAELAAAYASCDIFVFPSTTDTFGNVVLEAQASGLPAIVTDAGGPRENVIDRKTGFIVKADDEQAFYHAARKLLQDPARRKAMAEAAREAVERRSFRKAFEMTWDLYRGIRGQTADGIVLPEAV